MDHQHHLPGEIVAGNREIMRLEKIQLYLAQNLTANLHAANVALQFKMSISSLHHLFKKHRQVSYHKYVESLRIEKAMKLLQSNDMSVKEVMYATGYKNRKTFNNAFKKKYKHTPSCFKK
jgi:transcriptional regulator GlxA family with amidase domain